MDFEKLQTAFEERKLGEELPEESMHEIALDVERRSREKALEQKSEDRRQIWSGLVIAFFQLLAFGG